MARRHPLDIRLGEPKLEFSARVAQSRAGRQADPLDRAPEPETTAGAFGEAGALPNGGGALRKTPLSFCFSEALAHRMLDPVAVGALVPATATAALGRRSWSARWRRRDL